MKYTRNESGEVVPVTGCQKCPHMVMGAVDLQPVMFCCVPKLRAGGKYKASNRRLIGRWTGSYHATCPLASDPQNAAPIAEAKK